MANKLVTSVSKNTLQKQALNRELSRIVEVLKTKYKSEKIIAYGSVASGKIHEWSDIDLVVVNKIRKRFYDRIGEVLHVIDSGKAVDVLIYTPDEFSRMSQENWFVGEEIIKKGKVLYAV